jgi:hypothetical protein
MLAVSKRLAELLGLDASKEVTLNVAPVVKVVAGLDLDAI